MRVEPAAQTIPEGSATTVDVVVDNAIDLGAYQFTLTFDSSVAAFVSVASGSFLSSTGRSVTCQPPVVAEGTVQRTCTTISASPSGPDGSGVLAVVTFDGVSPGFSALNLSDVILVNVAGDSQLPLVTQDGSLEVTPAPVVAGADLFGGTIVFQDIGDGSLVPHPSVPSRLTAEAVQVGGKAAIFKEPGEADLFLGAGPLVIEERVANVPFGNGLGAFEVHIRFNEEVVSVEIEEGPFLSSTGRTSHCLTAAGGGVVRLSCFTTGDDQPGPTGSGALAVLTVRSVSGLQLRAAPENSIPVVLEDIATRTRLTDTSGKRIPVALLNDATVLVRALEGDVNTDCRVNVEDQQRMVSHFGATLGSPQYSLFLDLEPALAPDGDNDINDMQVVYGRIGSTCDDPHSESAPVGGIAELAEVAGTPLETGDSSGSSTSLLTSVAGAFAAGALALGGAAWYARRRWARLFQARTG